MENNSELSEMELHTRRIAEYAEYTAEWQIRQLEKPVNERWRSIKTAELVAIVREIEHRFPSRRLTTWSELEQLFVPEGLRNGCRGNEQGSLFTPLDIDTLIGVTLYFRLGFSQPLPAPSNAPPLKKKTYLELIRLSTKNNPENLRFVSPQNRALFHFRPAGMSPMEFFEKLFKLHRGVELSGQEDRHNEFRQLANPELQGIHPQLGRAGVHNTIPDALAGAWYLLVSGKEKLCPHCLVFFKPGPGDSKSGFCSGCEEEHQKKRHNKNQRESKARKASILSPLLLAQKS